MSEYRRITVSLDRAEFLALRDEADRNLRHPRDQARYFVRSALGLADPPPVENTKAPAVVSQADAGAFAVQS